MPRRHLLFSPAPLRAPAPRLVAGLLLSMLIATGASAAETSGAVPTDPATMSPTAVAMSRMSIAGFKKGAREDADAKSEVVACVQRIDDALLAPALTRELRGKLTGEELAGVDRFFAGEHGRQFVEVIVASTNTSGPPEIPQGTPFAAAVDAFGNTPAAQKLFSTFGQGSEQLKQVFLTELLPVYRACDPVDVDSFTPPTLQEDN